MNKSAWIMCALLLCSQNAISQSNNDVWHNGLKQLMGCNEQADDEKAAVLLTQQAQNGDAVAQVTLGAMLATESDARDLPKAKHWFEMAASQGNLQAQNELVTLASLAGDQTQQAHWQNLVEKQIKYDRLKRIWQLAALGAEKWAVQTEATPHKGLAKITLDNQILMVDVRAVGQAVEHHDDHARTVGAMLLATGNGVKQDIKLAHKWLTIAAENNNARAQTVLGQLLRFGWDGEPENPIKGAYWLEKAAQQNDVAAMTLYATMLMNGEAVKQDKLAAMQYLRQAAQAGDSVAILMCAMSDLEANNRTSAALLFCQAAQKGNDSVRSIIGALYGWGNAAVPGESEKLTEARRFAQRGETEAQIMLGLLYGEGWGTVRDKHLAQQWFEKALEKGDEEALLPLGLFYAEEQQTQKAEKLFELAEQKKAYAFISDLSVLQLMFDAYDKLPVDDLLINTDKQSVQQRKQRIERKIYFLKHMASKKNEPAKMLLDIIEKGWGHSQ